ncbi:MAG: hypothetical protein INR62_03915 [Rhodospirillales bacterium]|nr:hypothetical protein [Acetobacter sp.]
MVPKDASFPSPGTGEVLKRVHAAGATARALPPVDQQFPGLKPVRMCLLAMPGP